MAGKLIIIEGADGSGKATQAKLLIESLSKLSPVTYFDFPRYVESTFGRLLGRCLNGEHGDFIGLDPYLASLPYMLDRATATDKIRSALEQGYVVCNRYTTSSLAHQAAKYPPEKRQAIVTFIEEAEYSELKIPKPDFVLFLSVPVQTSHELVKKKSKRPYQGQADHDQAEKDQHHQSSSIQAYKELAQTRPEWHVIECVENDQLLPPETIHQKILDAILPRVDQELLLCRVKPTATIR